MSKLLPRLPVPPTANDVMVWDGTEFRPSKSVAINPIMAAISATALALAIGTGISDANRIGFLPSTAVPGSEALTLYVGGNAGPVWTARSGVVDLTMPDGGNFAYGTGTGTQHGTSTSQKQSFYGATPIVQPTGTTDLRTALINLGLYASGGASPLNLNGGAFTAQSVTVSGLTSGRVPYVTTAGLLTNDAGLLYVSNILTLGDGTTISTLRMDGAAGQSRTFAFRSAGLNRWLINCSSTAETGSDAGSNFTIQAYNDAGTVIDTPITIPRAVGSAISFSRPLNTGTTIGDGTSAATLLFNGAAGQTRQLTARTNGSTRWVMVLASGTAEGGSNAGSNFSLQAFDDSAVSIDNPISIARAAGSAINLARPVNPIYTEATAAVPAVTCTATSTITGGVTDGYATSIRITPTYSAATALTVTRHNYIDLNNVSLAGVGPAALTDACVFRFNAAIGTHKAVDSGTTKTSPGTVTAWVKININGTIHYLPAYSSKTT